MWICCVNKNPPVHNKMLKTNIYRFQCFQCAKSRSNELMSNQWMKSVYLNGNDVITVGVEGHVNMSYGKKLKMDLSLYSSYCEGVLDTK